MKMTEPAASWCARQGEAPSWCHQEAGQEYILVTSTGWKVSRAVVFQAPNKGHQRRRWHPTPVLLPGKSHGRRSLVGCSPLGSRGVRHDRATSLSFFTFMHWRRQWQPTPVFLPGESQGRGSLVGYRLWGRTESDTTEVT